MDSARGATPNKSQSVPTLGVRTPVEIMLREPRIGDGMPDSNPAQPEGLPEVDASGYARKPGSMPWEEMVVTVESKGPRNMQGIDSHEIPVPYQRDTTEVHSTPLGNPPPEPSKPCDCLASAGAVGDFTDPNLVAELETERDQLAAENEALKDALGDIYLRHSRPGHPGRDTMMLGRP